MKRACESRAPLPVQAMRGWTPTQQGLAVLSYAAMCDEHGAIDGRQRRMADTMALAVPLVSALAEAFASKRAARHTGEAARYLLTVLMMRLDASARR